MWDARRLSRIAAGAVAGGLLVAGAGMANLVWPLELSLLLVVLATAPPALVLGIRAGTWRTVALAAAALLPAVLVALWLAVLLWSAAHGGLE